MFSVKVTGSFPDLDRQWIDVDCPCCRLETPAALRDVRLGNVIICRGCKANIRLIDHLGQYHQMRRKLERAFNGLFLAFRG